MQYKVQCRRLSNARPRVGANKSAAKAGDKMQQEDATKDSGIAVVTSLTKKEKLLKTNTCQNHT